MLADNPTASAALASAGGSDTFMGSGGDSISGIDNIGGVGGRIGTSSVQQSSRSASVASRFASNVSRSASVAASSLASSLGSLDETKTLNTHEEWKGGESGDGTVPSTTGGGDDAGNRGRGGSSNRVGTASMGVTGFSPGRGPASGGVRKRPHTTSM